MKLVPPPPGELRIVAVRKEFSEGQQIVVDAEPIPFDADGILVD